jgi:cytochrome c553
MESGNDLGNAPGVESRVYVTCHFTPVRERRMSPAPASGLSQAQRRHAVVGPLFASVPGGLARGLLVAAGVLVSAGAALAQAPAKPDPAKGQQIAAQACAACHGADGNSTSPSNPKLAGQHADYLYKQLQNFKVKPGAKEAERANAVMAGFAASLSGLRRLPRCRRQQHQPEQPEARGPARRLPLQTAAELQGQAWRQGG